MVGGKFANLADQLNAIDAGHGEIGDQEINLDAGLEFLEGFFATAGFC